MFGKFFTVKKTLCGNQVNCFGFGCIGFSALGKDLNNKFNLGSNLLFINKDNKEALSVILGDYINPQMLFEHIKKYQFSTPVEVSFFSAKVKGKRHFLCGGRVC